MKLSSQNFQLFSYKRTNDVLIHKKSNERYATLVYSETVVSLRSNICLFPEKLYISPVLMNI